ncbi:leucine-rich repeat domain-containing protein [Candidatus Babeliales bacterium]|nr:leucine-rich repeat domain-containing protein [Candidatus Babeliales bacterium]MCF7899650.1 leucine-rich repeat domain-containing protein [Candidatus Babeliales bacterium]
MNKKFKLFLIIFLYIFQNNNLKAKHDNILITELINKYCHELEYIQQSAPIFKIVEYLSNLKLAQSQNIFWDLFQTCVNLKLDGVCHALAREYINFIENPKYSIFFIADSLISEEIKTFIKKQYFLKINDKSLMFDKSEKPITISFYDLIITKQLIILNNKLDLSNLNLENMDSLVPIDFLDQFDLKNNFIKKIPAQIGDFTKLKNLNLSNNQIEELPEQICNLKNLVNLDLSNNQLKKLPQNIKNLDNLWRLNLDNNCLQDLPEDLADLKNLKFLSLKNNPIKNLPEKLLSKKNLFIKN